MAAIGTVKKVGDRWVARLTFTDESGNPQDTRRRFKTKALATAFLEAERKTAPTAAPIRQRDRITIGELCDMYDDEVAHAPIVTADGQSEGLKDWRGERELSRQLKAQIGTKTLKSITPADIRAFRRRLTTEPKSATDPTPKRGSIRINRIMSFYRRLLYYAVEEKRLLDRSPWPTKKRGRQSKGKSLFYNEESRKERIPLEMELRALAVCDDDLEQFGLVRSLFILLMETSCRVVEIRRLRWDQVDLEGRRITLGSETKTGRARTIPLTARAVEVLSSLPRTADYVLPNPKGKPFSGEFLAREWACVRTAANIPETKQLRDIRRESASRLIDAGVPIAYVSQHLGHTSIQMTMRYLHVDPDAVDEIPEALDRYRREAMKKLEQNARVN